jgi:uncharacterized protein Yka (UPF0111/DUF47 family)
MSAVRKRMDFEFKKILDGRDIDIDMEEAKELQQNIIKKLNEGILMPDNVHDILDLLEMRRVHGEHWEAPSDS